MADVRTGSEERDIPETAARSSPAVERNCDPIAAVLVEWLPAHGLILEVASGSGEHALAFAKRFPDLDWQPSDPNPTALASIEAWQRGGPGNLRPPLTLDAAAPDWPMDQADAILCINMAHISPWKATLGLLDGAKRLLPQGGPIIFYGPWIVDDIETAPSNLAFDADLKARDPQWGLRSLTELRGEASLRGSTFTDCRQMPANNVMLLFRRLISPTA